MKTLIQVFIILLFFSFHINAQETPSAYQHQIDSVQTVLNKESLEDTSRVIALNHLARLCIYNYQYTRGLLAANAARVLAKKARYPQGEGMYLRTLDVLHSDWEGKPYDILTFWSFEEIKKTESPLNIQTTTKVDQVKMIKALEIASKAMEEKGYLEMEAHLHNLMASQYLKIKNIDQALESIGKAEDLFVLMKLHLPLIESKILKSLIFKQVGRDLDVRKEELQMARICEEQKDDREKALLYSLVGRYYLYHSTQIVLAADYLIKSIQILENIEETYCLATVYFYAGAAFTMLELKQKAVDYLDKSFELRKSSKTDDSFTYFYMFYGYRLIDNNELEKAEQMFEIGKSLNVGNSELLNSEGYLFMARGQFEKAIEKFYDRNELHNINRGEPDKTNRYTNYYIAYCFNKLANFQESNRFALASYRQSEGSGFEGRNLNNASLLLADNYDNLGQIQKAFFYLKRYTDIVKKNDLQLATDRTAEIEIQAIVNKSVYEKEILEKEKVEQERVNQTQRWWIFSIAAGLISLLLVLYLLLKNNQNKQKANKILSRQKEEIDLQRAKAETTLSNLKSTQAQLIQSEKMASLGELTAGIAHEIQNPLNFVNNFSEVSSELVHELKEELDKGDINEAKAISDDVIQNLQKINHHGNRASSIVKGMLEHSRTSSGKKELTDLNALADEYLRLAYHGLRAKNKDFNAEMVTDFDPNLPKIDVISQDIGRVFLNLINNGFQAIEEQSKKGIEDFKPILTVSTKSESGQIVISINDNGPGIPDAIKDKIFQPFFTTKDTGKGTGLGLSLSYDIVKAHGGGIAVESDGAGTNFTIKLPIT